MERRCYLVNCEGWRLSGHGFFFKVGVDTFFKNLVAISKLEAPQGRYEASHVLRTHIYILGAALKNLVVQAT